MKHSMLNYYREKQRQVESETIYNTQCPFCSMQCKKQVIEQKYVKRKSYLTKGVDNPTTHGRLCIKGMNAYQHAVHKDRVLEPLHKQNGEFVPISWEKALEMIREQFTAIQAAHGKDAVGVYGSGSITNEEAYLLGKFARVGLQTKYIDYNGRFCMASAATAGNAVFGLDRGLTNSLSEIPKAKCIILAGTNLAECQPTIMPYFEEARKNGSYIIVIDPRETETAKMADLHLKVKPGKDAALANALLKVIEKEGLINESFVKERTNGWEEMKAHLTSLNLEEAAALASVPLKDIELAAKAFAKAPTGMIFTARGVEQQTDGHMAVRNFLNLLLLTGKIGQEGSGYGAVTGQSNGQGGREHGQKADQLPGYRSITKKEDRDYVAGMWGVKEEDLPGKGVSAYEMMEKVHEREIRSMLLMCSNPIVSTPNASFVKEALASLDFFVAIDLFISETAQMADLILPASSYLEDEGTMTNVEGRVTLREANKKPEGKSRHDWQILCDIAKVLGKEEYFPFTSAEEVFNELRTASKGGRADYYGITYDRIREEQGILWPCPSLDHKGTHRLFEESFATADGKAVLSVVSNDAELKKEAVSEDYPLYLTTGRIMSHYLTGVQTRKSTNLAAHFYESFMEIHPETAGEYGIPENELVEIQSKRGTIVVRSRISEHIRKDTIFVPFHWAEDQNVNMLVPKDLDPNCGMPGYKVSAVKIRRHEPSFV
ncbi:assimilatory nitrate reductase catalytic subunit NasC [Alkalicoccus daliensis]|uniref:Assimilatory nitrate reductase catalytic subunit n=1 Tax=Alkalicoccus daliensis TaxID=745820 RepID=A0A1H0FVE3_9BACI|nr:nitrate reductase [Alkalicoccus daliensis]SDN98532.1 assimilatory nitrate reductase catalytic subunit [Alkalicoccus daliensis]